MNKLKEYINSIIGLSKVKISFFVALSGVAGYLIASGEIGFVLLPLTLGIFILASGSATLNSIQEIDTDAIMVRTKNRPLPTSAISIKPAFFLSILMLLSGSYLIYISSNIEAVIIGLTTLFVYNGIYTPLKRRTPLSLIPGSISGALPPAIGWVAAGGAISDPKFLVFGLFLFVWQVPHFCYVLLMHGVDYNKAGLPTIIRYFNLQNFKKFTYFGVVALAISCLLMSIMGLTSHNVIDVLLVVAGVVLVWRARHLLYANRQFSSRLAFIDINVYVLMVVILLSIDKFV